MFVWRCGYGAPNDIAAVAARELLVLEFKGKSFRNIAWDKRTTSESAKILGEAIGKPELPWVQFKDKDTLNGASKSGEYLGSEDRGSNPCGETFIVIGNHIDIRFQNIYKTYGFDIVYLRCNSPK